MSKGKSRDDIHRWLSRHYSYVHRRKDAGDLAAIALSGLFDRDYYLNEYGDVAKSGIDPLIHYVDFGVAENRNPSALFDTAYYVSTTQSLPKGANPVLHYLKAGLDERRPTRPAHQRKVDLGNWSLPPAPPPIASTPRKPFTFNKRVVVYTAVAGAYDVLEPPAVRPPNCDFIAFSDQPMMAEGWQVRPINYLHADTTRAARFTKLHPHIYFPDYEYSIWIDGNIGVRGDVREFISALNDETPVGIFQHPLRRCIYVEGEECIKRKKDHPDIINKHLARYRAEGFPRNAGLWETNVVVRRHNDPNCTALMDAWWREMEIGSRRDQLSLPVVAHRLGVKIAPLDEPGTSARKHDLVTLTKHPAERKPASTTTFPATARRKVAADAIPITVGICVHNSPAESKACIESVLEARGPKDTIIVVDDASGAETAAMLDSFAGSHQRLKLIRHESNRGYTPSANDVLKNSQAPWTFLLNSDTIVPPRALRKIVACGEQFSQIGIVGPLSNAASWQSVPRLTGPDGKFKVNEIPPGLSIADMDGLCEELASGIVPFVPLLNGFCYAVRHKLTEKIGFLDEASFPVGYGEEDDFSLRAGAAGYVCAIATDAYIYHAKSATFTADRRRPLVEQGAAALRRKHSPERLTAAVLVLRQNPEIARIRERMMQRLSGMMAQGAE
jgi:GT2 family glycosyltransferase